LLGQNYVNSNSVFGLTFILEIFELFETKIGQMRI
jgi:hypothetical protein